jgi:Uma2 family endonuclease
VTVIHDEPSLRPHRFTVEDYERMGSVGIIREDARVELLDGQVITMSPIGPPHGGCVTATSRLLTFRAGERAIVMVQSAVRLDRHSEPEPDIAVVRPRPDCYRTSHATPPDMFLLIEVGDSSARFDREIKAPMYARAGVPELWLVDLLAEEVQVCRAPGLAGYADVSTRRRGERLSPSALPDVVITVDEILG